MTRSITLVHEMFHRVQPSLHLMAPDTLNPQLDTEAGRVWLQLEWRALAGGREVRIVRVASRLKRWRQWRDLPRGKSCGRQLRA